MSQKWPSCSLGARAYTGPTPATTSQRIFFHQSAFKASSFKNNSYHIPRASDTRAKGLRKDLQENTQELGACPMRTESDTQSCPHQSRTGPHAPSNCHPHVALFLQHEGRSYLEGILLGKVQNHVPPLPGCIGSIKHLGREPTRQMSGAREMESRPGRPKGRLCSFERVETKTGRGR